MEVHLNGQGIRQAMSSPEVKREIERRAAAIRDACNAESGWGGYESGPEEHNWRASANVWTIAEYASEARNNRMLRNVDAGR